MTKEPLPSLPTPDELVRLALSQMSNGDITNFTIEGLAREFRFADGVLHGAYLYRHLTKKQYLNAQCALRGEIRRLMDTHGAWFELTPDNQWRNDDE